MTQCVLSVDVYHVPRISQDVVGAAGLPLDSFQKKAGWEECCGLQGAVNVSGTIRM